MASVSACLEVSERLYKEPTGSIDFTSQAELLYQFLVCVFMFLIK